MSASSTAARPKATKRRKRKTPKKQYLGRIYICRDETGKQIFEHVGWFDKKKERDDAVAKAKAERAAKAIASNDIPVCDEYVDRFLAEYAERNRESSTDIMEERLAPFRRDFTGRRLDLPRAEFKDWLNGEGDWSHRKPIPKGYRPAYVTLYSGGIDSPKTGDVLVPLAVPARDAIANRERNELGLIFLSKTGKRLSQPTLSGYWAQVKAASGLNFDFYHATKHYGVHYMWVERGMSPRAIASLAGWKVSTVIEMLETYGHGDVGAMEEVDVNFADAGKGQIRHLRTIRELSASDGQSPTPTEELEVAA